MFRSLYLPKAWYGMLFVSFFLILTFEYIKYFERNIFVRINLSNKCEESRVKHKKITNFNLKRFLEIDKSYYLPRIIIFFEKKMLCSFQMNGNTLNVEKLESRVKELTPDDFTGDVHEIIEQCVNQGTSRSDQSYVLNLYVHNAYFTPCVFFSVH